MRTDPVLAWLVDELLDVELPTHDVPAVAEFIKRRVAQLERVNVSGFPVLPELLEAQQWGPELREVASQVVADIARRGRRADIAPLLMHTDRGVRIQTAAQVLPRAKPSSK